MINRITRILSALLAFVLLFPSLARGAFSFPQLSQENLDAIERDFAANTLLHDALPPSSMGSIFGFELGVIAGLTKAPGLNQQVQRVASPSDVAQIPHAGLVGAVTVPGGLTIEGTYLPTMAASDFSYQQYAFGLKWTMTNGIILLPLNLAIRGFYGQSKLTFSQTLTDPISTLQVPVSGTNDSTVKGVQLFVSPKWIPVLEPYAGVGYLSATGTLGTSGPTAATLFDFTSETSATSSPTSTQVFAGLDVRLLLLGFGAEWSRAFGTDSYTGKFSLKF